MARFTGGWIKVHRSLAEKDIAQNLFLFGIWNYLLLIANYKESQIIWKGKQRILQPGQCLIKIRELSEKWECSTKTIWRWFHYLHDTERISLETETHGTVITICNWKEYQITLDDRETPSKHQVNTEETPSKHEGNYSEERVPLKKERIKEGKNTKVGIRTDYPPIFIQIWEAYGKIGDKKRSYACFEKLKLSEQDLETLKQAIKNYYNHKPGWQAPQHLSTFLNGDWRQYLEPLPNGHVVITESLFDFLPHNQRPKHEQ